MKTITLNFHECEHDGDLENYTDDIKKADGKVINSYLDDEEETAYVEVEVEDIQMFLFKFKKTDSFGFSQYGY